MRSLLAIGGQATAKQITTSWSRACAGGKFMVLIAALFLLAGPSHLDAASAAGRSSLQLQVRPDEQMQTRAGAVMLKIRLARGTTAHVWAADACTSPVGQSYEIPASGIYSIPFDALERVSNDANYRTEKVCLKSSDAALSDSLPVEIATTRNTPGVRSPFVGGAAGWERTTHAGLTTLSNP